jgi:hypothetical protein
VRRIDNINGSSTDCDVFKQFVFDRGVDRLLSLESIYIFNNINQKNRKIIIYICI